MNKEETLEHLISLRRDIAWQGTQTNLKIVQALEVAINTIEKSLKETNQTENKTIIFKLDVGEAIKSIQDKKQNPRNILEEQIKVLQESQGKCLLQGKHEEVALITKTILEVISHLKSLKDANISLDLKKGSIINDMAEVITNAIKETSLGI